MDDYADENITYLEFHLIRSSRWMDDDVDEILWICNSVQLGLGATQTAQRDDRRGGSADGCFVTTLMQTRN